MSSPASLLFSALFAFRQKNRLFYGENRECTAHEPLSLSILPERKVDPMDIYNKPPLDEYLVHYGVKGMRWGVRRTPEQLGHLKQTYRSKVTTASDHYKRAINRVNESREATNKRDRKSNEGLAVYQYDKALKYEKQARKIERKLKRSGVEIQRSPKQMQLQQEAAELFVKKCAPRRVVEITVNEVQIGVQLAARTALPSLPWGKYLVATGYSKHKVKKQKT